MTEIAETVKKLISTVTPGRETILDVAREMVGEGEKATPKTSLVVSSRKLNPEAPRAPTRQESPPRSHNFLSAKSLADYLSRYGSRETVVFADPHEETIQAVINETAEKGFEVVTMKPQTHPLWAPWEEKCGEKMDIRDFARFVMENRRSISTPDGRELALTFSQVRASISVEVMAGRGQARGQDSVNGLVVRTRVQSGQEQSSMVELPDTITLSVPLYVDSPRRQVEVDLLVEAETDGRVSVTISAGTVAEARVACFEGMVADIRKAIQETGAVLTFGSVAHGQWGYLPERGSDEIRQQQPGRNY